MARLEITIDVIIHATEDLKKYFSAFEEQFSIRQEDFTISIVDGHFDNQISTLNTKLSKAKAQEFLKKFLTMLKTEQKKELIQDLQSRTEISNLFLRIGKQEFIQNEVVFKDNEAIRIKIFTPIYNKKDTAKVFREILEV